MGSEGSLIHAQTPMTKAGVRQGTEVVRKREAMMKVVATQP